MVVLRRGTDFRDHSEISRSLKPLEGVSEAISATYDELMVVHGDRRGQVVLKGLPLDEESLRSRLNEAMSEGEDLTAVAPPLTVRVDQEKKILRLLSDSKGFVLDDIDLIEALGESKIISGTASRRSSYQELFTA